MTARQFTFAIKKVLKAHGVDAHVKSETVGFSGFGYGDGCTATVTVAEAIPRKAKDALAEVEKVFRASGGGPHFSERQPSAFMIELAGPPYPFGGRVGITMDKKDNDNVVSNHHKHQPGRRIGGMTNGERIEVVPPYEPRFVSQEQLTELYNLYHLARVPLSGTDKDNRHGRMIWACREFHKANPEISETGAYKDLSASMANG